MGRTGQITPYAVLEPVDVGGVTVRQASLHNYDDLAKKDIREGDTVVVKRAGDVIPQVVKPVLDLRPSGTHPAQPPEVCPVCNQPTTRLGDDVALVCINAACPAQLVRQIGYFVSRGAMDIEGVAEPIRLAFALADVEFEDDRINFSQWPELKPKTPHGGNRRHRKRLPDTRRRNVVLPSGVKKRLV